MIGMPDFLSEHPDFVTPGRGEFGVKEYAAS
jgi:hypothetical protein